MVKDGTGVRWDRSPMLDPEDNIDFGKENKDVPDAKKKIRKLLKGMEACITFSKPFI